MQNVTALTPTDWERIKIAEYARILAKIFEEECEYDPEGGEFSRDVAEMYREEGGQS